MSENSPGGRRRHYRGTLARPHVLTRDEIAVHGGGFGFFRRLAVNRVADARFERKLRSLCRNLRVDLDDPEWRDRLLVALLRAHVSGFRELLPGSVGPRSQFTEIEQQRIDQLIDNRPPRVARWKAAWPFALEKLGRLAGEDAVRKLAKQMEENFKHRRRPPRRR